MYKYRSPVSPARRLLHAFFITVLVASPPSSVKGRKFTRCRGLAKFGVDFVVHSAHPDGEFLPRSHLRRGLLEGIPQILGTVPTCVEVGEAGDERHL